MVKNTRQFCEDILKFLRSEYNDSYKFEIKHFVVVPPYLIPDNEKINLIITMKPGYELVIVNESIQYLFQLYLSDDFIEERNQYRWQKELIDMIECT